MNSQNKQKTRYCIIGCKYSRYLLATLLFLLTITACSKLQPLSKTVYAPFLNEGEFTGLKKLGDSFESIQLDYALDSSTGGELLLDSCTTVAATKEESIVPSQLHLLQLMKVNCTAAKYYFTASNSKVTTSVLPSGMNENFITSLPGVAVPDLGGDTMTEREGTLAEVEPKLNVMTLTENAAEVELAGDLVVNYLIMARGDFDNDGSEDLLLRLDWYISTAFGKGFDLIMLSQNPTYETPKIVWRQ